MSPIEIIKFFFVGYIDFEDRVSQKLYWIIVPIVVLIMLLMFGLTAALNNGWGNLTFWGKLIIFMVPLVSIIVKRLHDINLPGTIAVFLLVMLFIPFIGLLGVLIALIVLGLIPGSKGKNKYGDDPLNPNNHLEIFD